MRIGTAAATKPTEFSSEIQKTSSSQSSRKLPSPTQRAGVSRSYSWKASQKLTPAGTRTSAPSPTR